MTNRQSPFAYVQALVRTGEHLTAEGNTEKYVPFIINRALSRHVSHLPAVSIVNAFPALWPDAQFEYLLLTTPQTGRWIPWEKQKRGDIPLSRIAEVLGVGIRDAEDYWPLFSEQDQTHILALINQSSV
jgi:hypothetical protein